ncbi:MAG: hypothetical protein V4560_03870 [Bacteroidota bacterium]
MLKEVYSLKNDTTKIKLIQEASLDKNNRAGLKIQNNLLFGTDKWFDAIEKGTITKHIITGSVSRIYNSGHNDFPEFEITTNDDKSAFPIMGDVGLYRLEDNIHLIYVEQKLKRGSISKCILEIKIS